MIQGTHSTDASVAPAQDAPAEFPVTRLPEQASLAQAVALVADAIRQAVARRQSGLLVDARAVGFASPSLVERQRFIRCWAEASAGRVRVALLARPDFIDDERFGIVVANAFGLAAEVFADEDEARAWLRGSVTGSGPAGQAR